MTSAAPSLYDLYQAWYATRAPEVAELIERLAARAARGRPAIGGATADAALANWMEIASRYEFGDIYRLLAALPHGHKAHAVERMKRVAKWPDDPRVSLALAKLVDAQYFRSGNRYFYRYLFQTLARIGDVRVVPLLQKVLDEGLVSRTGFDLEFYLRGKVKTLLETLAQRPPLPPPPEIHAWRAALATAPDERSAEDCLAAVYAQPHDDGPRLVFADWLLEHNDARGEFITLQFAKDKSRAAERREKELLRSHWYEWLGPLAPVVSKTGLVFERGFVAACRIDARSSLAVGAVDRDPAWATLRAYELPPANEAVCDRLLDHLIALGARRV